MPRHPLLGVLAFATVFGAVFDLVIELWLMNIGFYTYPQIIGSCQRSGARVSASGASTPGSCGTGT
jgi:hypothetical protein